MWAFGASAFGHQSAGDTRGPHGGSSSGGGAPHRSARARCVARRRGGHAERSRGLRQSSAQSPTAPSTPYFIPSQPEAAEGGSGAGSPAADATVHDVPSAPNSSFSATAPSAVEENDERPLISGSLSKSSASVASAGAGRSYVLARRTAATVVAQLGAGGPATPPRRAAVSPPALRRRVASPQLTHDAHAHIEVAADATAADVAAELARVARITPRGSAGDSRRVSLQYDPRWRALLLRSEALMATMSLPQLSQCVRAVATLRAAPGDTWLAALLLHSGTALTAVQSAPPAPRHVAHLAWGVASLGAAPPAAWLAALETAARGAATHPELSAVNVSNLFWALAALRATPADATVAALCAAATRLLPDFAPQTVANTLYALGRLGKVPPCGLLQRLASAVARDAARYAPEELSGAIWALGALGVRPGTAWHEAFDAAAAARLAHSKTKSKTSSGCGFGARAASVTLLSLARLDHHPGRAALGAYCAELLRCAAQRRIGAQALANALFAFASLHNVLRDRWQAACVAGRPDVSLLPRGDGDAGNPLPFPPPEALDALYAATAPLLGGCKPAELTQLLWAASQLGHDPGSAWRAALCIAACGCATAGTSGTPTLGPGLRRFGPRELAAVLLSYVHLGVAPPPSFLDAWAAAAAPQWHAFEARHAVHAAWALTACDAPRRAASGAASLAAAWARLAQACAQEEAATGAPEALMPPAGWAQAAQAGLVCSGGDSDDAADPLAALPPACRVACAAALRHNARRGTASAMQRDVADALFAGLGVSAELEATAAGGTASLDLAIEAHALRGLPGVPPRRVALEVDGPSHDVRCGASGKRRRSGGTAMRSRLLAAAGWRPLVLRHDAWPRGFDARVDALSSLLRGAEDDGALDEAATDAELAHAMQAAMRARQAAGRSA